MKRSFVLILVVLALLLSLADDGHGTSQKNRSAKDKRAAAKEADSANQREHETESLLSTIKAQQANIVKLTKTISDENETQQEKNRADNAPWPLLSGLTPVKVQQGLLIVGALYTFFAAWQLLQIRRQANIADRTLNLVERPFLGYEIKRVFWQDAGLGDVRLRVNYSLINSGRTPARITGHNSVLCRTSSKVLPQEASYDQSAERLTGLTIPAGRQHETSTWLQLPRVEEKIVQLGVEGTDAFVHFFTYVDYKDGSGKPHSSYLCGIVTPGRFRERNLYLTFPPSHQYKEDT